MSWVYEGSEEKEKPKITSVKKGYTLRQDLSFKMTNQKSQESGFSWNISD